MKRRETYERKPTLWDVIPGWVYAVALTALLGFAVVQNWGS
jgi:hypothetical protein